jgi:nicotinamidase-related amidase
MSETGELFMTADLLDRNRSALVIIDVQEKLFPRVHEHERVLARLDLLITAAKLIGIPLLLTEQYPKGLGATIEEIRGMIPDTKPLTKTDFSCVAAAGFKEQLASLNRDQIVLAGIEAHVCVAQTAMDLASLGGKVVVVADAVSSRRPFDAQTALARLQQLGLILSTAEAVVFEWLRRAGTEEFKALQPKLKEL